MPHLPKLPPKKTLCLLLRYEAETGKLFWKRRDARFFEPGIPDKKIRGWNNGWDGKEAFTAEQHGYRVGMVARVRAKAHRVIWKMVHGEEPPSLDHINGVRSDNRLANLRAAAPLENQRNRRKNVNNSSGCTGVVRTPSKRWKVQIKVKGEMLYVGTFSDFEVAVLARKTAEREHGFHINHGSSLV